MNGYDRNIAVENDVHKALKQYCLDCSLPIYKSANAIIKKFLESKGYRTNFCNKNNQSEAI
ncbi:hypothetical protein [Cysteiniphilum marinum]|uniref:hypothetical protein n=1 Tax=Cysteiniphilum marinum TaxID=2774191 RepID=UPI00193A759B|nr:hypothetical protein [Cysteiniphilum marinum]